MIASRKHAHVGASFRDAVVMMQGTPAWWRLSSCTVSSYPKWRKHCSMESRESHDAVGVLPPQNFLIGIAVGLLVEREVETIANHRLRVPRGL